MSEYSAIIMQKLATYRELLRLQVSTISEQDVELMEVLSRDPDVQAYLEQKRKEG